MKIIFSKIFFSDFFLWSPKVGFSGKGPSPLWIFFHYKLNCALWIFFNPMWDFIKNKSEKILKKILRKSIGYPKVGFSLKKPTLRKAESHCSRTSQVTMSYIFKKFNKFLRKKLEMTMVWNNVIIKKIGVQKRHFILWNSPISVLQVGRCHFDMVKTQCLK